MGSDLCNHLPSSSEWYLGKMVHISHFPLVWAVLASILCQEACKLSPGLIKANRISRCAGTERHSGPASYNETGRFAAGSSGLDGVPDFGAGELMSWDSL